MDAELELVAMISHSGTQGQTGPASLPPFPLFLHPKERLSYLNAVVPQTHLAGRVAEEYQ